jgi:hypothetical protein
MSSDGYNILIPDLCAQRQPQLTIPIWGAIQSLGHTVVTMNMKYTYEMYRKMRYDSHGGYEIFQFYQQDSMRKGRIDFGFSAGLLVVMEDARKQEAHHLIDECGIPNIILLHDPHSLQTDKLAQIGAPEWEHTFIICTSRQYAKMVEQLGVKRVTYMPPATNTRVYYKYTRIPDNPARPLKNDDPRLTSDFDVVFVGAHGFKREEMLTAVADSGVRLAVFGPGWQDSPLKPYWRNTAHYIDDVNTIYNAAKVVLDLPNDNVRLDDYMSLRLFDAAATSATIIAYQHAELDEQFEPHFEYVPFKTTEELVKNVSYFASNDDAREPIGRRAWQRVQDDHTWERRIDYILPQLEMHLLKAQQG